MFHFVSPGEEKAVIVILKRYTEFWAIRECQGSLLIQLKDGVFKEQIISVQQVDTSIGELTTTVA